MKFTQQDWSRVRAVLIPDNNVDEVDRWIKRQQDWLDIPETERMLIEHLGLEYTLEQALDVLEKEYGDNKPERRSHKEVMESAPSRMRKTAFERDFISRKNGKFNEEDEDSYDPADSEKFRQRVKDILGGLLKQYSDVTPNDLAQITDYANCQAQSEYLHERIIVLLSTDSDKDNTVKIMRIRNVLDTLSKTMREIEKLLGIDRTTRDKENDKTEVEEAIIETERAGLWAKNFAVQVTHCETLLGWYLPSFNEMALDIAFVCPKCHQSVEFHFIPTPEMIAAATEPDWIAEEESKYYKPTDELTERIVSAKEMEIDDDSIPDFDAGNDSGEDEPANPSDGS